MHHLLASVEAISSCRDRDMLGEHLAEAVATVLGDGRVLLFATGATTGNWQLAAAAGLPAGGDADVAALGAVLADRALRLREVAFEERDERFLGAFPLGADDRRRGARVLLIAAQTSPSAAQIEHIAWLVRIYGNHLGLIDYSETDTLTSLLNRKTFDEAFDRLLTVRTRAGRAMPAIERRQLAEPQHWLAVADVDHFKRVNDSFGHLFGDEVLIRVANVMRGVFRDGDQLFRFGGEEFVIMLQVAEQAQALAAVERFRRAIETHEFPQVGHVTCSLGLTRIAGSEVPSDVIGRADRALYFAKNNGRNRACVYEDLVAAGLLAAPATPSVEPDFDIDALFA